MQKLLIVGCGDIGIKLASLLGPDMQVYGLRRNISDLPDRIIGIAADVTQPDSLAPLKAISFDAVVICLTPGEASDQRYQQIYVQGSANVLAALNADCLGRLIFISSTSVYHQSDNEWVNEDSATEPTRYSGQRLLEAEALCQHYGEQQGVPATMLRFAGIYGPGRLRMVRDVQAGKGSMDLYSNRIHRDDCAGVIHHLLALPAEQLKPCYIGVDDRPVRINEVKSWLAGQLQCEAPETLANSSGRGAKRCSNQRLTKSGYELIYSDFQAGYRSILEDLNYTG